jgi:hypothetical protein
VPLATPRLAFLLVMLALLVAARTAHAEKRTKSVVVLSDGVAPGSVAALRLVLGDDFTVGEASKLRASLDRWSRASLVEALAGDSRDDLLNDVARAARAQRIDAVVVVEVRTAHRKRTARLVLIDPRRALAPFETEAKLGPRDGITDGARLQALLLPRLVALSAPEEFAPMEPDPIVVDEPTRPAAPSPAAPPAPAAEKDVALRQSAKAPNKDFAHALVVVDPYVGLGTRHFGYVDRVTTGQRSYDLTAAPMMGVGAALYPFASLDQPVLDAFGLVGDYGRAVGLQSAASTGQRVDTSWSHFDVAVRGRAAVGERVSVGAKVGYGVIDYSFDNAGKLAPELPGSTYRYLRAGVDGRLEVWKIVLMAGFDYLAVQSSSGVADRYPHATVGGIDAVLGIGIPFAGHFEARTGLHYQRFFYSMHPVVGEPSVAGGATDEYGRWDTSVAFYY